jgi:hypothetical protein
LFRLIIDFEYALVLEPSNNAIKNDLQGLLEADAGKSNKVQRKRVIIQDVNRTNVAEAAEETISEDRKDLNLTSDSPLANSLPISGSRHEETHTPSNVMVEDSALNDKDLDVVNEGLATSPKLESIPSHSAPAKCSKNGRMSKLSSSTALNQKQTDPRLSNFKKLPSTLYDFERQWKSLPPRSLDLLEYLSVFWTYVAI